MSISGFTSWVDIFLEYLALTPLGDEKNGLKSHDSMFSCTFMYESSKETLITTIINQVSLMCITKY